MLDGILHKVDNCIALEPRETTEAKIACKHRENVQILLKEKQHVSCHTLIVLDSDMSDSTKELEGEAEYVAIITRVSDQERSIWFSHEDLLCCISTNGTPIPVTLKQN